MAHQVKAALLAALIAGACTDYRVAQAQTQIQTPPPAPTQPATPATDTKPADTPSASQSTTTPAPPAQQQPGPPATPTAGQQPSLPEAPAPAQNATGNQQAKKECDKKPCPAELIDWYKRFSNGPQVKPLTPKEKGWLATKNVIDPFNLITILGLSAISVASDSHSAYGPGFPGWGRNVGVSFTEDITGEFFGTFLIPSIAHQDPHYHRMPHATYKRRIFHAIYQVAWTQGDNGKGMLNYADLVGFGIEDEIGNLYVPGRETNAKATAQRYATGLATAPIDNFITEFLPDVASHIHVQVVIVQRIINQVANKASGTTAGGS